MSVILRDGTAAAASDGGNKGVSNSLDIFFCESSTNILEKLVLGNVRDGRIVDGERCNASANDQSTKRLEKTAKSRQIMVVPNELISRRIVSCEPR